MDTKLEVHGLTKRFGATVAADAIQFGVNTGELIGFLGSSGSGKTTVLRMIAGLEDPTSGEIFIDGRRVNDVPVQQRNIGFVFQQYALFAHLTVFENIAFGLRIRRWPRPEIAARVGELTRLLGIQSLEARYPHELSGGQRQRVAIARALAPRPSLLLMDEPFGALDAKVRQELRQWLVDLHDELNVTTLFVTHDQEEAMEICDRILVLNQGRLEQIGTPQEIYEEPATEFVARFIGVMNVLETTVTDGVARCGPLSFAAHGRREQDVGGHREGDRLLIGVRPYYVRLSRDLHHFPYHATVRRVYFLGVAIRIEIETPEGLVLRSRMNKEAFRQAGIEAGAAVSFEISQYRLIPTTNRDDRRY